MLIIDLLYINLNPQVLIILSNVSHVDLFLYIKYMFKKSFQNFVLINGILSK